MQHESEHSALLFLRADTPATLETSLAALAGPDILDLPEKDAREDATKIAAALGWLAAHPGWLMIVDNVDDPAAVAAVDKLLARLSGGKVIVTGRAGNFPASLRKLELGVLDKPASVAFLLERTDADRAQSPDDAKLAQELAGELDGLALGLEQAGAYIATERIGFARYLEALARQARDRARLVRQDADELRPRRGPRRDLGDLGRPPDAGRPPPARTPRLSRAGADPQFAARRRRARRPRRLRRARGARQSLRLFARLARGGRGRQGGAGRFRRASAGAGFRAAKHDGGAARRGVAGGAGVGECSVCRRSAGRPKLAGPRPARAACPRSRQAGGRGGDRSADRAAFQSSCCAAPSENAPRRSRADVPTRAGDRRGEPWAGSSRRGEDLNNLAELLRATNRLGEAEPLYRRALAIFEASYGPDHPDVARGLNNLAAFLHATNRLGEAEPLFRRALAIFEASYGPAHPDVATALNNLAGLLQDTDRLGEAEPHYRRALAIDEASYGPDHPKVALRLNNLASLLRATDRLGEAEPLFRRALAIDEASYGPDHPSVASDLNNLAGLLRATNRLGEAEPLYRRALAIFEASYGPDHPHTATVRENLAALEASRG